MGMKLRFALACFAVRSIGGGLWRLVPGLRATDTGVKDSFTTLCFCVWNYAVFVLL